MSNPPAEGALASRRDISRWRLPANALSAVKVPAPEHDAAGALVVVQELAATDDDQVEAAATSARRNAA
jgi:hypothetical protein